MATQTYPYDDDRMTYDSDVLHGYILTYNGVLQGLGEDLYQYMEVADADVFLRRVSFSIYRFIKSYNKMNAYQWVEYIMAKDSGIREVLYEALLGQVEYMLASGGALIGLQHGVGLEKGKVIPLEELRGSRKIAESTEMLLLNSGLLYTGHYPRFQDELYRVDY